MKNSRQRKGIEEQRGKEEERIVGGGDNPAHKVYNVYVLFCFNNRGKWIESRFSKKYMILFICVFFIIA